VPGPDHGSRIARLHPQASAAAAFRSCRQVPRRPPTGRGDLVAELNPHETELNPHKAIWLSRRLAAPTQIKNGAFSHGPEPIARQLATPELTVTLPAIRCP
jgi:hypothetical protein